MVPKRFAVFYLAIVLDFQFGKILLVVIHVDCHLLTLKVEKHEPDKENTAPSPMQHSLQNEAPSL